MVFKRLSSKLTVTLFVLLLLMSASFIGFALWSTPKFLQELNQWLNLELADNIVKEKKLILNKKVNQDALQSVFMGLMVVNPIIEVYLIDPEGRILAYSAPEGVVKRQAIDLKPIHQFVEKKKFPVLGNDPRDLVRDKVFSAAAVYDQGILQGYLYIILGGQAFDSVVELLQTSYTLQLWAGAIVINLCIALLAGFMMFHHITRRVRQLAENMEQFKQSDFQHSMTHINHNDEFQVDEIDQLGTTFQEMSERIIHQVKLLQQNDTFRREMIANISHDLGTPLASLQGYLETLQLKQNQLTEQQQAEYIAIAYKHSKRLRKLIAELFELSTLESQHAPLNCESFSISELVQDVCLKFHLAAEKKGLTLSTAISSQPAFIYADIGLIQRVLENLIENAIKYTPAGGQVTVSLITDQKKIITLITNTGPGISEQDMPHIFERFYRVEKHRNLEGTGLGLAIAQRIMQLHDSCIAVRSEQNINTTFSFSLPRNNQINFSL